MKYHVTIFLMILSAACASRGNRKDPGALISQKDSAAVWIPLKKAGVATELRLPAQLAAWQEVSIFPKINGYVKKVFVDIGSEVRSGQMLMELEAPESLDATARARERFAQARAVYSIDRENYSRLLEASATEGAVSPQDLSTARSRMQADSALANSERMGWQLQQNLQDYLRVTAPFSGVITERNVFPGTLVSAESKDRPMLQLKEVDHLRLQVDVPEASAGNLRTGDTISFFTNAFPGKKMMGRISRRSMNVNLQFRSERMEADVDNRDGMLQPGMYADVILYSPGSRLAFSVPRSSLVVSTEGKYVIKSAGQREISVPVITGNETKEFVEIFGDLKEGDLVKLKANEDVKE